MTSPWKQKKEFQYIIGLLILPLLCSTGVRAATPGHVDGPMIVVGDILAHCNGEGCQLEVAESPLPGKSKVVTKREVIGALKQAGIDSKRYRIPARRRVKRPARKESVVVLENKYREAIEKILPPGVVLEKLGRTSEIQVPRGGYQVEAKWPGEKTFRRRVSFPVVLLEGGVPFRKVQIAATLSFRMRLPVAAHDVERGTVLDPQAIEWVEMEVNRHDLRVASKAEEVIGLKLKKPIARGETFPKEDLEKVTVVHRGQWLSVESVQGLVSIRAMGEAKQDGALGERIRVLVPAANRLLWARVIGSRKAMVVP